MFPRPQDDLRICAACGLRLGLRRIRNLRRLTDDEVEKIVSALLEHLELSNWKIEPRNAGVSGWAGAFMKQLRVESRKLRCND